MHFIPASHLDPFLLSQGLFFTCKIFDYTAQQQVPRMKSFKGYWRSPRRGRAKVNDDASETLVQQLQVHSKQPPQDPDLSQSLLRLRLKLTHTYIYNDMLSPSLHIISLHVSSEKIQIWFIKRDMIDSVLCSSSIPFPVPLVFATRLVKVTWSSIEEGQWAHLSLQCVKWDIDNDSGQPVCHHKKEECEV